MTSNQSDVVTRRVDADEAKVAYAPQVIQVAAQELTIFTETPHMIEALIRDIQSAKTRIWIEIYIFLNDVAGNRVSEALVERAKSGVDVRVLYDSLGSLATPNAFFAQMVEGGVQVYSYHTVWQALGRGLRFFQVFNSRNHRKLFIVDNDIAYFGGMNIVDQNITDQKDIKNLPTSTGWRDVHVRLTGASQNVLAKSFERSWHFAHHEKAFPREKQLSISKTITSQGEAIQFFDCGPRRELARPFKIFHKLIKSARKSIVISMAYCLPPGKIIRAMRRARRLGVEIDIIVPAESDVKLVQWATEFLYEKWIKQGIRIFEREERMLHSKVITVDDEWTIIGSCNLDFRSFRINLEILATIHSKPCAEMIRNICDHEMQNSRQITLQDCQEHQWWKKLRNRIAYAFRWWL
jgi:cardiolipin synthase A/B